MKSYLGSSCLVLAITTSLLLGTNPARAELIVSDFEAPEYTASQPIGGQDGWTQSTMGGRVTPDTISGYTFVLEGSQSVWTTSGHNAATKLFNSVGATAADIYELSWLQASPDALNPNVQHGLFLINASGSTPVGIYARNTSGSQTTTASTIRMFTAAGELDTGIPYISGGSGTPALNKIYRFTLRFNFNKFEVTGFYEDVTNDPGNRIFLATMAFSSNVLPNAQTVAANFGVGLWTTGGVVGHDRITLTAAPPVPDDGSISVTAFETSAGYVAGEDIIGVDGWFSYSGTSAGVTLPDPENSGYTLVLEGSQSYLLGINPSAYGRPWGAASTGIAESTTLSWLMRSEGTTGSGIAGLYVGPDLVTPGGSTPAGVQFNEAVGEFELAGLGGPVATGVTFASHTTYKVEMELDFVNDRFHAYVTDVTNEGERTSLGEAYFGVPMDAATNAAQGGVVIAISGGARPLVLDNIRLKASETVPVADAARSGFGNTWIRNHPFAISGVPTSEESWNATGGMGTYEAAGMTTAWIYGHQPYPQSEALAAGLPIHSHLITDAPDSGARAFNQVNVEGGVTAWMIGDEPGRLQMEDYRLLTDYVKTHAPGALTFVNVFPIYASNAQLWGDSSNPSYTYEQYLEDTMTIIKPDVLMYDYYPFRLDGGPVDYNGYFFNLTAVRNKALQHDVPYWFWMQSFESQTISMRLPSESDLRMQMFSHLAAGFTGMSYWTYGPRNGESAFFDANDQPTHLYATAASANAEGANLGNVLRSMTSTGLGFVPGLQSTATPTGLANWTPGVGGDTHLQSVTINGASTSTHNGLVGLFEEDTGQMAFMIVNLNQGANLSAAQAALTFTLQFDSSVDSLLMVNRETGQQELVALNNNTLQVTLPGGTGNLYKYATHQLVYTAGPGGSLDGSTIQTVASGGSGTAVTAVPEAGASFASWSDSVTANPRTDQNVTADVNVTARFQSARGVPIEWYISHGLSPSNGQTWADLDDSDSDGDGIPDWEEYMANTDPTDPSSSLEITDIDVGSSVVVHFSPSSPERRYTLQVSDDMEGWTNVSGQGPRPGTGAADSMTDAAPPQPNAFYQIVVDNL